MTTKRQRPRTKFGWRDNVLVYVAAAVLVGLVAIALYGYLSGAWDALPEIAPTS